MKKEDHISSEGKRLEGKYANYFEIGNAACEFLFDFAQLYQGREKVHFHTRIITTPQGAKALQDTLRESIHEYEKRFGTIPEDDDEEAGSADNGEKQPSTGQQD